MIGLLTIFAGLTGLPVPIKAEAFPGLPETGMEVGCMQMTSGHTLSGGEGFGGYSGMVLDPKGGTSVLLSDAGHLLLTSITLADDGRVEEVGQGDLRYIRHDGPGRNDTEAIAPFGDGRWLIAREGRDDVVEVALTSEHAEVVRQVIDIADVIDLPNNAGVEAAAFAGETLLMVPEHQSGQQQTPILAWRDGTLSEIATYQGVDAFDVTDIAVDTEGDRLFFLERAFSPAMGPRARVTALPLSMVLAGEGEVLRPLELGRLGLFEGVDNMEGIAFFRSGDGSANLMLVSDDNFRDIQRTVLMTMRLGAACPLASP